MEPGLRDREYTTIAAAWEADSALLQWSPVLETGNTSCKAFLERSTGCSCNGARS